MMKSALERFLTYAKIETTSSETTGTHPSTNCQYDLARLLAEELADLGLEEVTVSPQCIVTAALPDNRPFGSPAVPVLGFIAHLDTSPAVSGKNAAPFVFVYDGKPIRLANGSEIPVDGALLSCIGETLVVTDGTTLLGADDKAGIAAIMTAVDTLLHGTKPNGEPYRHGKIKVAFTPDEEIGEGSLFFDVPAFGADYAVTVDGEMPGKINRETFHGVKAALTVQGIDIHPGGAKGVMVNASILLADILSRLPKDMAPETTDGYQPYVHPYQTSGTVAEAKAEIILRSFDDAGMEKVRTALDNTAESVRQENPKAVIDIKYAEQYPNMGEKLKECPEFLAAIEESVRETGIEPVWDPVRGGTDGSNLTAMGLPTPNIFTGGHNFHSTKEWLSVNKMEQTVQVLLNLAEKMTTLKK